MGRPNIGDHVLAGLVGGLAGCFAMEHFQRLLGRLSPDLGGAPGAGGQQYRRPQSEPSTYLAADKITRAATGRPLRAENRPAGGSIVHYIFGGTVGAAYGLLTAYRPAAASGRGMPFAVAVWLVADEAGMPLAGLARRPSAYPPTDHLSTFATHLLFGATLETVGRVCLWPDPDRQRPPVWASLRLRP